MKIMIVPHLPTLFGRRYNLAKALSEKENDVHFIVWDMPYPLTFKSAIRHIFNSWGNTSYAHSGFTVHKISRLPFFWPRVNGIIFRYQIRKIFTNNNIQVILSQSYTNETATPRELPLIYDMNDDHAAFADIYGSILYRIGFKLLEVKETVREQITNALLVTYVSSALGEIAAKNNPNTMFLPNGVDELAFSYPVQTQSDDHIQLTYISNFGPWSEIEHVVRAIKLLKARYPDIILNVVGEGTEISKAKSLVIQQNLSQNIIFFGHVSDRKKIFSIIDGSDLCLNISEKNAFRDAAFPIKVVEYSARGKKVISSDLREVRTLNFENVYIRKNIADPEILSRDIQTALEMKFDGQTIAKKITNDYKWENIVTILEDEIIKLRTQGLIK